MKGHIRPSPVIPYTRNAAAAAPPTVHMCALGVSVPRGAQEVFDAIDVIGLDPLFHQHQINGGGG